MKKIVENSSVDARIERTQVQLRAALLNLLGKIPLDELTIRSLAAEAGIGYNTFFRHYASKQALLDAVAVDEIRHLVQLAVAALLQADTQAACLALCKYVEQHRALWKTLLTGGAAAVMREEFILQMQKVAEGWPPPSDRDLPKDLAVTLAVSSTLELLIWWLRQDKPVSAKRAALLLDRHIIAPTVDMEAAPRNSQRRTRSVAS